MTTSHSHKGKRTGPKLNTRKKGKISSAVLTNKETPFSSSKQEKEKGHLKPNIKGRRERPLKHDREEGGKGLLKIGPVEREEEEKRGKIEKRKYWHRRGRSWIREKNERL